MSRLDAILRSHYIPARQLGAGQVDADRLRGQLANLESQLSTHYLVLVAMTAVVFVVGLVVLITFVDEPEHVVALFGAMGLSVGGAIELMRRIGRELFQARLLLALAADVDSETLNEIVRTLVKQG